MMVAAINFDENRVDLISLPRDTYAKIPGVKGIYKLNASLNCGGGYEAAGGAGFLKTCEAASWMLGGIPINYYYAVTMPAVKQLVDAVGGVDYNLEMTYTMMGRRYTAGPTHLNGQGVLDYLRVRKNIQSGGDLNRVNRQKKMLIAIFKSLQEQNLILKVPEILSSFDGQLYTNCTLGQTAALTKFGYGLDGGNIGMYSMTSSSGSKHEHLQLELLPDGSDQACTDHQGRLRRGRAKGTGVYAGLREVPLGGHDRHAVPRHDGATRRVCFRRARRGRSAADGNPDDGADGDADARRDHYTVCHPGADRRADANAEPEPEPESES